MKTLLLSAVLLLSGCATCSEQLDADISKYGRDIAMTKFDACNQRRHHQAQIWQHGWDGVANNYQQRANSYSNQLPRIYNYNINQY